MNKSGRKVTSILLILGLIFIILLVTFLFIRPASDITKEHFTETMPGLALFFALLDVMGEGGMVIAMIVFLVILHRINPEPKIHRLLLTGLLFIFTGSLTDVLGEVYGAWEVISIVENVGILGGLTIIALALMRWILTLKSNGEILSRSVKQKAEDLALANEVLKDEIEKRKKTENRLKDSIREKEILMQELHHRVKNNLQVIVSILNLQTHHTGSEEVVHELQKASSRVHSMSLIHELLYSSDNVTQITARSYIENLVNHISSLHQQNQIDIKWEIDTDDCTLKLNKAISCGLIINECITNALKHAFADKKNGTIRIIFSLSDDHLYELRISDNGCGIMQQCEKNDSPSMGRIIVESLAEQLDGTLKFESGKGTTVSLTFPE